MTKRAVSLIPQARAVLEKKRFTKARHLARELTISPSLAGQILSAMPEWSKYTNPGTRPTWIKEDEN